jgi:CheY-like chemotaxis protein
MRIRPSSSSAPPARILLVDDNINGLNARKTVLEELGHKIVTATSGSEALELFGRHKFDLVVTDYKMPRMDGLELISRLRKQAAGIPIVLISGFADALGLNEQNTSADTVIQKSNNEVSHLLRAVARLLARKPAPKPAKKPADSAKRTPKGKRKTG